MDQAIEAIAENFHGVINSAAVIIGGVETLRASWRDMTDGQRDLILEMVGEQSLTIQELLGELSRRPPAELHAAIERHSGAAENIEIAKHAAQTLEI